MSTCTTNVEVIYRGVGRHNNKIMNILKIEVQLYHLFSGHYTCPNWTQNSKLFQIIKFDCKIIYYDRQGKEKCMLIEWLNETILVSIFGKLFLQFTCLLVRSQRFKNIFLDSKEEIVIKITLKIWTIFIDKNNKYFCKNFTNNIFYFIIK